MRDLLILGGIAILSALAWTATVDAGGHGHGSAHGPDPHGHGGLAGHMKHGEGHGETVGIVSSTAILLREPVPGPVAIELITAGPVVGAPEQMVEGHRESPAVHPVAHVPLRAEFGKAVIPQPTAPAVAGSDQNGATTAQPDPNAIPWSPRPPGAAGPGRRVSGRPGPGQPGPGRRPGPRW
jgi:hypothetical protein